MKAFVVIPAYNEEEKIYQVIKGVQKYCSNIIIVDDASSDNTLDKVQKCDGVTVLHHILNRGQGAALQTGITYALDHGADIIITFDADSQHNPADITRLVKAVKHSGVDVVLGSRFLVAKPKIFWTRIITLKLALLHQWIFTGLKVSDNHCGLRAFTKGAALKINITQDRMSHASEILDQISKSKLRYREIPVKIKYTSYARVKGQKGWSGSLHILYDFFIGRLLSK